MSFCCSSPVPKKGSPERPGHALLRAAARGPLWMNTTWCSMSRLIEIGRPRASTRRVLMRTMKPVRRGAGTTRDGNFVSKAPKLIAGERSV